MLHDGRSVRVAVIGGSRIPFCRSHSIYRKRTNQDLMTAALQGLVAKLDLRGQTMGDVALGAVIKHSRDWNLARESVIDSGLTLRTPGMDLQRACGTSIEAAILIANKIALGQIDCGIAGGTDTVSDAPIVFRDEFRHILLDVHAARSAAQRIMPWLRLRPRHIAPQFPGVVEPRTGLSMGESMEATAKEWDVQREHQDQLALASHVKAAAAFDSAESSGTGRPMRSSAFGHSWRSTRCRSSTSVRNRVLDRLSKPSTRCINPLLNSTLRSSQLNSAERSNASRPSRTIL